MQTLVCFHWITGLAISVFRGSEVDADRMMGDPRYAQCFWRDLDGTPWMGLASLRAMPDFATFEPVGDLVAIGWRVERVVVGDPPESVLWTWTSPEGEAQSLPAALDAVAVPLPTT